MGEPDYNPDPLPSSGAAVMIFVFVGLGAAALFAIFDALWSAFAQ